MPSKGFWNVCAPIFARYVPASRSSNANVPSSADVVEPTFPPAVSRSSTVTPGRPSSWLSTLPIVPPPGLKSRQTTPVIPPCSGSGWTACVAPAGTSSGGIPVSGSSAVPPVGTGVRSV